MTEWRVMSVGVCLAVCTGSLVCAMTEQLTLVGGVTRSALIDCVVGTDPADSSWYGLIAGVIRDYLLIPLSVLLTFLERTPILSLSQYIIPLVKTPGGLTTAIMLALVLSSVASGAPGNHARHDATGTRFDPEMAGVDTVEDT